MDEETQLTRNPGRPAGVTDADMARRARAISKHLRLGRKRKEICAIESLTVAEFQSAKRWVTRGWTDNFECFGDLVLSEQERLEEIKELIEAVKLEDGSAIEKSAAIGKLQRLAHDILFDLTEMGLKLGTLDRDRLKVDERQTIRVSFGDEGILPWFSKDRAIEVPQ